MSCYTTLPIQTIRGALAYADQYADEPERSYEDPDVFTALFTLADEIHRLRSAVLTDE